MKKLLLLLSVVSLLFSSCTPTKEEKAQKLIKEYITTNTDDPSSYEPVEFGKMDSIYTSIYTDEECNRLERILRSEQDKVFNKNISLYGASESEKKAINEEIEVAVRMRDVASSDLEQYKSNFKPKFDGYTMTHTLRAKNKMGALIKGQILFVFDKDVSQIIKTIDGK